MPRVFYSENCICTTVSDALGFILIMTQALSESNSGPKFSRTSVIRIRLDSGFRISCHGWLLENHWKFLALYSGDEVRCPVCNTCHPLILNAVRHRGCQRFAYFGLIAELPSFVFTKNMELCWDLDKWNIDWIWRPWGQGTICSRKVGEWAAIHMYSVDGLLIQSNWNEPALFSRGEFKYLFLWWDASNWSRNLAIRTRHGNSCLWRLCSEWFLGSDLLQTKPGSVVWPYQKIQTLWRHPWRGNGHKRLGMARRPHEEHKAQEVCPTQRACLPNRCLLSAPWHMPADPVRYAHAR